MAHDDDRALQKRLERLQAAMEPRPTRRDARQQRREEKRARRKQSGSGAGGSLAVAIAFIAAAIALGKPGLFVPGIILAIVGGVRLLQTALAKPQSDPTRPSIGMGASVASTATVEAGAVVEMGADIEDGAVVRAGAVVRMGATIAKNAVIEQGAVIGWGCDVEEGAVVEAGAIVGSGATVKKGARVPAGMRLPPGADWGQGAASPSPAAVPVRAAVVAPKDERRARIEESCARIESELQQLPESFREYLGATQQTAGALRQTCLELLERERALRAEASDESLKFLDTEHAELQKRVDAATDAQVKGSLGSALGAIADQKKQRLIIRTQADRLEAELTRLQWTLQGMSTQLIRLRTTGAEAGKPPSTEMMQSVQQLHSEIDAIADALEQVSLADRPGFQPVSDVTGEDSTRPLPDQRVR